MPTCETDRFPIVGIGASAGGIEALEALFSRLPAESGIAFVIVTHLSDARESLLHEVVARFTGMPVQVATDGAVVEPDHVYVMPAGAVLDFGAGRLRLKSAAGLKERHPIDIFLSALARERQEYSAGIILSGGDGDGALGIKAIKERGGLTIAQVANGHPPRHSSMPDTAIATGMVDFPIPAEEMGERLIEFSRSFAVVESMAADAPASGNVERGTVRTEIYDLLRAQMGHDFSGYKSKTFLRRVQRRMQVNRIDTLPGFVALLRNDPTEVVALFRDLLINVTNFFRDADAFNVLARQVVPALFKGRGADDVVRVWIPGCATGEEVYSIAMLLREHMDELRNVPRVQIFATDIDDQALVIARAARYPEALLDSVSEKRRQRFFVPDGSSYVVAKDIRDMCIFSPHSVLRDPPFSRIDLISCRNLLIYLGPEAQSQVLPTFRYSLRSGGYLFLGTSENIGQFSDLFVPVDKKNRLFRAEDGGASIRLPPALSTARAGMLDSAGSRPTLRATTMRQTVETYVLDRHTPPHVVVNGDGDINYYSARTGKYFETPPGAPNRQLLAMARKGLRLDLRSALHEATTLRQPARRDGIEFEDEELRVQVLSLTIEPLPSSSDEPLFLVVFHDQGPTLSADEARSRHRGEQEISLHLERELRDTRERLQSMIEEYETAIEELRSSNEELLSVNEEMQSTNEELEASKEELQSLNEEMQTVNAELNIKVDALDLANTDLRNLFDSTSAATIFLDHAFTIRMFTPSAASVFKILPGDLGRPLTDLTSILDFPDLANALRTLRETGETFERQVNSVDGQAWFLARIAPYRDGNGESSGLVLTVTDVTEISKAEAHQRLLIAELNHRVKNMLAIVLAIATLTRRGSADLDVFFDAFSGRLAAMTRSYELVSRENWTGVSLREIAHTQFAPSGLERVTLGGENIRLDPKQAVSVSMILHELVTNAMKYGSLSTANGYVELTWERAQSENGHDVNLRWREREGPTVIKPEKTGFGLELVAREASQTLRNAPQLVFNPNGLEVDFAIADAISNEA